MQNLNHFDRLQSLGYTRLVPVIPPDAPISPKSSLLRRIEKGEDPRGKIPGIRWSDGSWSSYDWTAQEDVEISKWHGMGAGVGVKTGRGLVMIDADTLNIEHATIIKKAVEELCGPLPVRVGQYPKAGYIVRTDPDFAYTRVEFGERDDKGRLKDRVEILSEGRFFVAHGTHPKTGKPYRWPKDMPALKDVPFVPGEALTAFLEHLRPLLPAASELRREGATADAVVDQDTLRGDLEMIRKAVEATPNTSDRFPTREAYRDYGYAIKAAVGPEHEAEGFALYADWCARWQDGHNDPDVVRADWDRMKGPFRRGASWLYEIAGAELQAEAVAQTWFEQPSQHEPLFPVEEPERPKIAATPYGFTDPATIPPRQFLYGKHYIRQFVSATVAPSGVGKSSLIIAEALAMASGKPLLGVDVKQPLRVWLWNGEDPRDEMSRRIAATMMHYGLTPEDIGDRLFLDTGREMEIILASETKNGVKIAEPVSSAIVSTIEENRLDVVSVDPFVSSHRVPENDNGAIDMVTKRWARIADVTGTAIELVHHVRKLNGGDVTVEDSRGAVALLATARSKRALAKMSKGEAVRLGSESYQHRLFRIGDERNNLALPATDATAWFELKSIALGNGEGGSPVEQMMNGDQVGVVTVHHMERAGEAIDQDAKAVALDTLSSGEWRRDVRAGEAWAGVVVAQAFNLDLGDDADKATAKRILGEWIKSGVLRAVSRKDDHRKLREYVEVCETDKTSENEAGSVFE